MSLLFTNEILAAITQELESAKSSVQIITAYCKENTIRYLEQYIESTVIDKKIVLRFRLDDLIKGSTDFSVIEYCRNNGWKVYIRFDLHAKTYIVDNKRGIVGSANATNNGLSTINTRNMEIATLLDIDEKDIIKVNNLFRDAIYVSDNIWEKLKEQYNSINFEQSNESYKWSADIIKMFSPKIDTLFSYELPDINELNKNEYISFLDVYYSGDRENIKEIFRWSNAYMWLMSVLESNGGCLFFGKATELLHNALVNDPKPYRKDVKILLANLLALIEQLDMEEIIIDRPNYSQRLRLKSEN